MFTEPGISKICSIKDLESQNIAMTEPCSSKILKLQRVHILNPVLLGAVFSPLPRQTRKAFGNVEKIAEWQLYTHKISNADKWSYKMRSDQIFYLTLSKRRVNSPVDAQALLFLLSCTPVTLAFLKITVLNKRFCLDAPVTGFMVQKE